MSHLSQIATILATLTSYTITQWPDDLLIGYILYPDPKSANEDPFMDSEKFHLVIKSDSLANLETAIGKFLNVDSKLPSGYSFTTAGQPVWISSKRLTKEYDGTEFFSIFEIEGRWKI